MKKLKKTPPYDFFKNTPMIFLKTPPCTSARITVLCDLSRKGGQSLESFCSRKIWKYFDENSRGSFFSQGLARGQMAAHGLLKIQTQQLTKKLCTAQAYAPQWINMFFSWSFFLGSFESSESVWNLVMFIWHLWTQDLSFSYLFSKSGFRYSATQR